MNSIRVLRFADLPNNRIGGASRYMHGVADILRCDGHHIEMMFEDRLAGDVGSRMRRFVAPMRVLRMVRQCLAAGERLDAVDVHEPIASAYAAARLRDKSLPPLIACVYGLEDRAYAARLAYDRLKGKNTPWRTRIGSVSIRWPASWALRHADFVTVETKDDADYLRAQGIPAERIGFLHGAAAPVFFESPISSKPGRCGVLFVGTWIERKGILDLVPALIRLLERQPNLPVTLAGCGTSVDSVLVRFPERFRGHIEVIPRIDNDAEMARLYHQRQVFLLPSYFEGLPLALIEAAAAGMAIVATPICGMKDFVRHEQNGLLVAVGDSSGLDAAASQLVDNPALAARLGAQAALDARLYSWRRSADQFLAAVSAVGAFHREKR